MRKAVSRGGLTAGRVLRRRDLPPAGGGAAQRLRRQGRAGGGVGTRRGGRDTCGAAGRALARPRRTPLPQPVGNRDQPGRPAPWSARRPGRSRICFGACRLVVVLDGVQDPGNAGAIIRAAEAFGSTGVVFPQGHGQSVQPQDRARLGRVGLPGSAGPRPRCARARAALAPSATGRLRHACRRRAGRPREADLTRGCAIIIGSEGHGVSAGSARRRHPCPHPHRGRRVSERGHGGGYPAVRGQPPEGGRPMSLFDTTPPDDGRKPRVAAGRSDATAEPGGVSWARSTSSGRANRCACGSKETTSVPPSCGARRGPARPR